MNWIPLIISAGALVVSAIVMAVGVWTAINQTRAIETRNYLDVSNALAEKRRVFEEAREKKQIGKNELLEVFVLLEDLAHLYNKHAFGKITREFILGISVGITREMVRYKITQYLTSMLWDNFYINAMKKERDKGDEETFMELYKFSLKTLDPARIKVFLEEIMARGPVPYSPTYP